MPASITPGNLYIITAASGTGKTSLVHRLVQNFANLKISISHTTRHKRENEKDGVDYYFIKEDNFMAKVAGSEFLEHAVIYNNYYGTAEAVVKDDLAAGNDVILEIDWQGAEQVRRLMSDAISIFILPPSIDTLEQRLKSRGSDDDTEIQMRMRLAKEEISHCWSFDYLVVNDDFEQALTEVSSIMTACRLSIDKQQHQQAELLTNLLA